MAKKMTMNTAKKGAVTPIQMKQGKMPLNPKNANSTVC